MRRLFLAALLALWTFTSSAVEFNKQEAGAITWVVGSLMTQYHFRHAPLNDEISQAFLKMYIDSLDPNHMVFNQVDVDDFTAKYANVLAEMTKKGDASPAYDIFNRYLKRLDERNEFVQRIVKEPFDFTTDEKFVAVRNKLPWPKDANEMTNLWRVCVKYELLGDRIAFEDKVEKAKKDAKSPAKDKAKTAATGKDKADDKPLVFDPAESVKTVSKRYNRMVKINHEYDSAEVLQFYLSALGHAYDPHSDYMAPESATNFDIQSVKLSLTGIGASLRTTEDGFTRVEEILPGGPAALAKTLGKGDLIVAVAQGDKEPVDTVEMKLSRVVDMIRGEVGTEVRLTVIPVSSIDHSDRKIITLMRAKVELKESHAKARVIDHLDYQGNSQRFGIINLPQFYEDCADDVDKLLGRLKKENVAGVVLDLRRNGGGLLPEAVKLAGLFIPEGPVVQIKSLKQQPEILEDVDPKISYDGPLVVLVSHFSASASEIVAAALQDYGRALVIGDKSTHGKGTVQTLFPLNGVPQLRQIADPGKMKFTVQKFYRIAGGTTQKYGVTPDVMLPSVLDYLELGEVNLPYALEADKIPAAPYKAYDLVKPFAEELQKMANDRIRTNQDFKYLFEDIEMVKKRQEDKSISLNLDKRMKEKHEQEARDAARKKEQLARKATPDKTFDLTLDNVTKNEPMKLFAAKAKDNTPLASIDGDPDEDDSDLESAHDPHLTETLRILGDYVSLLNKSGTSASQKHLVLIH
jgi:carboxyl-terminal processing protease